MAQDIPALQGIDVVLYARKLSAAKTEPGHLIPYQTSLSFDPQRDSDNTVTKSGSVATTSSLETDLEVEFVNNWSQIADQFWDSLFDQEKMEFWIIYRKRKNADGKYFAFYMRGTVTEDKNDNDPDDVSSRDTTITVDYGPVRGWTALSTEQEAELAFIFRGVGAIEGEPKDDGTDGNGAAYNKASDAGVGIEADDAPSDNTGQGGEA